MKDRAIFEKFINSEIGANEAWKIVELFESERKIWRDELVKLEDKKMALESEISALLRQANELKDSILDAENKLKEREAKLADCKIPALSDMVLPSVEIINENGETKPAKPARDYYPRGYVARILEELVEFQEAHDTKQKMAELELENAKMRVELRDLERDHENLEKSLEAKNMRDTKGGKRA